ncbi:DDE-type integrase/transposase/recombinase, partial [Corynebacterium propinquum]|uniref:DDE-type integrase/transposase/recombinase n=1 Tax=Corynebacterium propinquum TaxID=43769 RepID=UPI00254250A1
MAEFSYVYTHQGLCYVAFITDVYSRWIFGYTVSRTKQSDFVLDALRQALSVGNRYDAKFSAVGIIYHSDAGSQGGFNWLSQHPEHGGMRRWLPRTGVRRPVICRW